MCPKKEIISLYLDNELPSPWKEKLEAHLEKCPECRSSLVKYESLNNLLRREDSVYLEPLIDPVRERVWDKLAISRGKSRSSFRRFPSNFLKKSISLPLPIAALTAVLILVFFLLSPRTNENLTAPALESLPVPAAVTQDHIQVDLDGFLYLDDMNSIIQYLSAMDGTNVMIINLPESSRLSRSGEPMLMNASDYSRRNSNR